MNARLRCTCDWYPQNAGGTYVEYVVEWDPDCPKHGVGILPGGDRIDPAVARTVVGPTDSPRRPA